MVNAKYIPPRIFIEELARYLKENVKEVQPPEWSLYAKTGNYKERVPDDPDWWYKRCASLLRKLYVHGPVGLERLRVSYGGRKNLGHKREHFSKAGGSAIRKALQQLEAAGLVMRLEKKGRVLTPKGKALLDTLAYNVFKQLAAEKPELVKYIS
ncbi:MAG: 30S ribosomal protein S19e [Thermofilaceae archaeon]